MFQQWVNLIRQWPFHSRAPPGNAVTEYSRCQTADSYHPLHTGEHLPKVPSKWWRTAVKLCGLQVCSPESSCAPPCQLSTLDFVVCVHWDVPGKIPTNKCRWGKRFRRGTWDCDEESSYMDRRVWFPRKIHCIRFDRRKYKNQLLVFKGKTAKIIILSYCSYNQNKI